MLSVLSNFSIKTKLALMLLFPILGLLYFSVVGMVEKSALFETLLEAIATVAAGRTFFGATITQAVQLSLQKHAEPKGAGSLTPRERDVLQQVASGHSNKEVAAQLGISISAVEKHVARAALFLMEWMGEE